MINVGLTEPKYSLGWNTDLLIQRYFINPGISPYINFKFCGGLAYSLLILLSKLLTKLRLKSPHFELSKRDIVGLKAFYCYGKIPYIIERQFADNNTRVVLTTSVMSEYYLSMIGSPFPQDQPVKDFDSRFPTHVPFHFFTEYGRAIFERVKLTSRRSVAIPFLLPYLDSYFPQQSSHGINIAFVGKHGKRKGLYNLLMALSMIPERDLRDANVSLFVVSTSRPYAIPGLTLNWKHSADYMFVEKLLCSSHILAMPTLHDSYGIVYVEAMAAGCTIIADNDFPRIEILSGSGINLPPLDIKLLSDKLRRLISTRQLIEMYGSMARARYETIYAPRIVSQSWKELFESTFDKE